MIATGISGAAPDNDVAKTFKMLSLLADPTAYADKMAALQQATDEYNKVLALVGPATEILTLREQVDADRAAAAKELAEAKQDAAKTKQEAKAAAKDVVDTAKAKAAQMTTAAQKLEADAAEQVAAVAKREQALNQAADELAARVAAFDVRASELDRAAATLAEQKKALAAERDRLIALHKQHIAELSQ